MVKVKIETNLKKLDRLRFQGFYLHRTIKLIRTPCPAYSFFENPHDFI